MHCCFLFCIELSSTMILFFFLGEELNLEQFYFCVLSVEWFSILYREQKAGSVRRPATCVFFRDSCSPPAGLLAVRCTPMTHAERHNNRSRFLTWCDVPTALEKYVVFFPWGCKRGPKNPFTWNNRPIIDRKILGFGFGYFLQITENRRHSYSSVG